MRVIAMGVTALGVAASLLQAQAADIATLKRGTYVLVSIPCSGAANNSIMEFDGVKFFHGRFCPASVTGKSGSKIVVTRPCSEGDNPPEPQTDTFIIETPTEFVLKNEVSEFDYRYCEQSELPVMWRTPVRTPGIEIPANGRASFDCATAKSASARLICADSDIGRADIALSKEFRDRLSTLTGKDRDNVIADQRRWINDRNAKCGLTSKNQAPVEQLLVAKSCMIREIAVRTGELGLGQRYAPATSFNESAWKRVSEKNDVSASTPKTPERTTADPDIMGVRLGNRIDALPREFSQLPFSRVGEHYELHACSNEEIVRRNVPALSNIDIGDMAAACLHLFAIGDVGPNARKIYAMMLHNYPMGAFQFMQGAANILINRYGNPTEQVIGDRGALLGWGIGREVLNRIEFQSIRADNSGLIFNTQNAFTVSNTRIIHAASLFKTGYQGTWGAYSDPVRAVILMVDQQMFEEANRIVVNNSNQQKRRALQEELQRSKTQGTRF